MSNPRVASRYAKSLLDLSIEQQQLDKVYADVVWLQSVCKTNSDFVNMLKSPVIGADKKIKILEAITTQKVSQLTDAFLKLLVNKTREYSLPEILKAFKEQYQKLEGIQAVTVTTAVPITNELKGVFLKKIQSIIGNEKIEMETAVREELIGGFTLEIGDTYVDASILRDLNDVKKQFASNEYIHNIR